MKLGIYYLYDRQGNFLGEIYAASIEDAMDEALLRKGIHAYSAVYAKDRNR